MPDSQSVTTYILLILGIIFFSVGVISTYIGKAWSHSGRVVYRAIEPKQFWWLVVTYYFVGCCFIGYFVHIVA
jgi:hypothetical protein